MSFQALEWALKSNFRRGSMQMPVEIRNFVTDVRRAKAIFDQIGMPEFMQHGKLYF
jgi:hypothetical protein